MVGASEGRLSPSPHLPSAGKAKAAWSEGPRRISFRFTNKIASRRFEAYSNATPGWLLALKNRPAECQAPHLPLLGRDAPLCRGWRASGCKFRGQHNETTKLCTPPVVCFKRTKTFKRETVEGWKFDHEDSKSDREILQIVYTVLGALLWMGATGEF